MYEKLKEAVVSSLHRVAQTMALENSIQKPVKQDFCLDANLLHMSSVSIGFGNANALEKLKSTLDARTVNLGKIKKQWSQR